MYTMNVGISLGLRLNESRITTNAVLHDTNTS